MLGKSAEEMRLITKERKIQRLQNENDELSCETDSSDGLLSQSQLDVTFVELAESRCSLTATAHCLDVCRTTLVRHSLAHLAVFHHGQRVGVMHLLDVALRSPCAAMDRSFIHFTPTQLKELLLRCPVRMEDVQLPIRPADSPASISHFVCESLAHDETRTPARAVENREDTKNDVKDHYSVPLCHVSLASVPGARRPALYRLYLVSGVVDLDSPSVCLWIVVLVSCGLLVVSNCITTLLLLIPLKFHTWCCFGPAHTPLRE